MRILFSFVGGNGHFDPLVPIARICEAAGHSIAFTGRPGMLPVIQSAGFNGFATGKDYGDTDQRHPLLEVNMDRENQALRDGFARRLARDRAEAIDALCATWHPDLIVCDEIDFGSMIAAQHLRLPYATVLVIATGAFVRREIVADALDELRAEYKLPPDPTLEMLHRYLVLSPFPRSYRDPASPVPATLHEFRSPANIAKHGEPPIWLTELSSDPTVYFTLGTVFNRESGDLFSRVIEGLHTLPINLIVTVGTHIDPAEFGPQPNNVHMERYIPQSMLLPLCDVVVSHGGSGSVMGAIAHGLPSVLIPMGADQPLNAKRCETLGIARVLDAMTATPDTIREAVMAVLNNPSYKVAAQHLQVDYAAMPSPEYIVPLLERLALEKQPLVAG